MSLIVRGGLCGGCVRGGMLLGGGTWPVGKGVVHFGERRWGWSGGCVALG